MVDGFDYYKTCLIVNHLADAFGGNGGSYFSVTNPRKSLWEEPITSSTPGKKMEGKKMSKVIVKYTHV